MRITVVGSGHGGCAIASVLSMHGHEVSLLKLGHTCHTENYEILARRKSIILKGIEGSGECPLRTVTTIPEEVLPNAELVLVIYVANYHAYIAEECARYLNENQVVVLNPGYCGSMLFRKKMLESGGCRLPLFVEFETLPYSSRLCGGGTVSIVSKNVRHPFATLPASRQSEAVDRLGSVLGECVKRRNIIEVALHNPNLVIHTVGVLLNASMIENPRWRFSMYRDGFSDSVWHVVNRLDAEKMSVLESMGLPRIPYFDEFKVRTFEDTSIDGLVGFRHYASEAPEGPFSIDHRYITEDVPMGLGLLHSLGVEMGVPTPTCDSLIHLASALLPKHDFWNELRSVKSMWDGSFAEMLKIVNE